MTTSSHQAAPSRFLALRFSTIRAALAERPMSRQTNKSDKRYNVDESFNPLHCST
jgi:hypothetical protein